MFVRMICLSFQLFFLVLGRVAPRSMLRPQPTCDSATFCVCVLAEGMLFLVTHGIAASNGISKFFLAL